MSLPLPGSELRKGPCNRKVDNCGPVLRKVRSTVPITCLSVEFCTGDGELLAQLAVIALEKLR